MRPSDGQGGRSAALAIALALCCGCTCVGDGRLDATGVEFGSYLGAMLDGGRDGMTVNDQVVTALGNRACFEPLVGVSGPYSHNEVFAVARPPLHPAIAAQKPHPPLLLLDVQWTGGADHVDLAFGDALKVPVQVWVLKAPPPNLGFSAELARKQLDGIWLDQGTGLEVGSWSVEDRTRDPDALVTQHVLPGGGTADYVALLRGTGDSRYAPGRINVYLVDTVEDSASNGYALADDMVAIGQLATPDLLAHEIGHCLDLEHTNLPDSLDPRLCFGTMIPCFDAANVMFQWSGDRRYFTEGQTFRAHLGPRSALNDALGLRPGQPTRDCDPLNPLLWFFTGGSLDDATACPTLEKRFWADGELPPN